jgi:hypothetical protein
MIFFILLLLLKDKFKFFGRNFLYAAHYRIDVIGTGNGGRNHRFLAIDMRERDYIKDGCMVSA